MLPASPSVLPPGAPLTGFSVALVAGLLAPPGILLVLPVLLGLLLAVRPGFRSVVSGALLGVLLGLGPSGRVGRPTPNAGRWAAHACHQLEGRVRETTPASEDGMRIVLAPVRLGTDEDARAVAGGVRLAVPAGGDVEPLPGDRIRASAWIRPVPGARNPGQADRRTRAARQGVLLEGRIASPSSVERLEASVSFGAEIARARSAAARRFDARLGAPDGALARALLLGDRSRLTRADRARFLRTGQGHLLAVSGLHVGLLLAAVLAFARRAGLRVRGAALVGLVVVLLYVPLAGSPPSAVRAGTGAALFFAGRLLGRRATGIRLLAAVATGLLVVHPIGIHDPALLLSLGAVLGILLLSPRILRLLVSPRPIVPGIVEPSRAPCRRALSVSLGAWLGVAPLLAIHLGRLSPTAAPLSVLTVPLTALVLAAGGIVLATPSLVGLDQLAASLFGLAVRLLRLVLDAALTLRAESLPARPPGTIWLLLYALTFLVAARGRSRAARAALLVLPCLLACVLWPRFVPPPAHPRLVLLDVGHGQAALLSLPDGRHVLLDAGSTGDRGVGRRVVVPALRALGVGRLDLVALSHLDEDHAGGLADVLDAFPVSRLALASSASLGAASELRRPGVRVEGVRAGQELLRGSWGRILVLHPPARLPPRLSRNDRSLALMIDVSARAGGTARVLLPGDLQTRGASLLRRTNDATSLRADVLLLPHHGRPGPGRDVVTEASGADLLLASTGRSVLPDLPPGTLATAALGAIVLELGPDGPRVRTPFAPRPSHDYDRPPDMHLALSTGRPEELWPVALGLLAFAVVSVRPLRWLDARAAGAASILGLVSLLAFGTTGLAALFAPFLVATLLGKLPGGGREGARTLRQVVANGVPALLGAALALAGEIGAGFAFFLGSLACLGADTCATEIGVRYGGTPRLAISGRRVAPGESGGVTPLGFLASVIGAGLAPLTAIALDGETASLAALPMTAGVLAAWLDSVLGATLQYRGKDTVTGRPTERRRTVNGPTSKVSGLVWLDNDAVNLVTGLFGGFVALLLAAWLTFPG